MRNSEIYSQSVELIKLLQSTWHMAWQTWSAFTEHGSAGMSCVRVVAKYSDPHMEKSKLLFNEYLKYVLVLS